MTKHSYSSSSRSLSSSPQRTHHKAKRVSNRRSKERPRYTRSTKNSIDKKMQNSPKKYKNYQKIDNEMTKNDKNIKNGKISKNNENSPKKMEKSDENYENSPRINRPYKNSISSSFEKLSPEKSPLKKRSPKKSNSKRVKRENSNERNTKENEPKEICTIFIAKIPPSLLNFVSISAFFQQFGEIVDIQIIRRVGQSFIQFETAKSAEMALKEGFPVFGDRRIILRSAFFDRKIFSAKQNIEISPNPNLILNNLTLNSANFAKNDQKIPNFSTKTMKLANFSQNALKTTNFANLSNFSNMKKIANFSNLTKLQNLKKISNLQNIKSQNSLLNFQNSLNKNVIQKDAPIDKRPRTVKVSNLPAEFFNLKFVKSRFYKYGFVEKLVVIKNDVYLTYSKRFMAENALKEKSFFNEKVIIEIFEGNLENLKNKTSNLKEKETTEEENEENDTKEVEIRLKTSRRSISSSTSKE